MQADFILNQPFIVPRKIFFNLNLKIKIIFILAFIFIIFLLVFYVFQISAMVLESYRVQNFQKKIKEISQENKRLEINLLQAISLENVAEKIQKLGFEKVDRIYYIKPYENPVVAK